MVFDVDHDFEGPRAPKAHLDTVNTNLSHHLGRPFTANFVNLVEEKWSVEVNLDGSGTLVVLTDILEQVSFRSGSRNF